MGYYCNRLANWLRDGRQVGKIGRGKEAGGDRGTWNETGRGRERERFSDESLVIIDPDVYPGVLGIA